MRLFILFVLSSVVLFSAKAEDREWPAFGVLSLDHYEAYFTPGLYKTYYIELDGHGSEAIESIEFPKDDGQVTMFWRGRSLMVYENLLTSDPAPYAKFVSEVSEFETRWDARHKRFSYDLSRDDLISSGEGSQAWLSENNDVTISPEDVHYGSESAYYEQAVADTDGACCYSQEEYEEINIGRHTMNCTFVAHPSWDVLCYFRSANSGLVDRVYYKRIENGTS